MLGPALPPAAPTLVLRTRNALRAGAGVHLAGGAGDAVLAPLWERHRRRALIQVSPPARAVSRPA